MPSSPPSLSQPPRDQSGISGEKIVSSDADGQDILQGSRDSVPAVVSAPNGLQRSISNASSNLGKLALVERRQLAPILVAVCAEAAFLQWIGRSPEDVVLTICFMLLSGGFAWPAWSHLKRMHRRLDEVFEKVETLEHAVRSSHPISHPPMATDRHNDEATVQDTGQREGSAPEPYVSVKNPVAAAVEPLENTHNNAKPCDIPVTLDGHGQHLATTEDPDPPVPTATLNPYRHDEPQGHTLNMVKPPDTDIAAGTAGQHASPSAPTQESSFSHWSPALLEMKQQIEQFAEGRFQRMSSLDPREPPNVVLLRRIGVRLLMSCASFSPADFASTIGYLGPLGATLYYPTGNPQRDKISAFTIAMDCLEDLEADIRGNDHTKIMSKLPELAQALSDLGLHAHALTTCGFALEILEGPYATAPDTSRLEVASVLSLQASILCDLKRKDDSIDAAHSAVALCEEHRESQGSPVPEVAYALLNYAVLLYSFGLMDEGAAVTFELQGEVDVDSGPDMKHIFSLSWLCLSVTRVEADDDMASFAADEAIKQSRASSDADTRAVLAGALLTKSKVLSSMGQNEAAWPVSAEATTLLRTIRVERPVFSLILAHALDTHSHHLMKADRGTESFLTAQDAVELWQTLRTSAPGPTARHLAWCLFHLAKFRQKGANRNTLNEELRIAKTAVTVFREVSPLDAPGLGESLYLYADRMLELDNNRDAAMYAEESVQYFREARLEESGKEKYALDLIFSLSLASSCLACTERGGDALEYAKQAVEVQHERKGTADGQYDIHLRKLLMDVIFRSTEIDKQEEAQPWFQELRHLDPPQDIGTGSGKPQPQGRNGPALRKETSYWMNPNTVSPKSTSGSTFSAPARTSSPSIHESKAREVASSAETSGPTPRVDKGKGREVRPPPAPSSPGRRQPDEEIFSPGAAAAQRRLAELGRAGPLSGNMLGAGGSEFLDNLLSAVGGRGRGGPGMGGGMGGRTLGGSDMGGMGPMGGFGMGGFGMNGPGSDGRPGGGRPRGMDGLGGLGDLSGLPSGLLSSLASLGQNRAGAVTGAEMFGPGFFGPGDRHGTANEGGEKKSGKNER
ncbi:hypothetical protein BJV78DRAFT_1150055 [Lactifluus subvellereus]|nr:hypothetical protein BJV78DRAFT_1150055 [Lactifluus subvellereus]